MVSLCPHRGIPAVFAAVERSQRKLLACPLKMAGNARCYDTDTTANITNDAVAPASGRTMPVVTSWI